MLEIKLGKYQHYKGKEYRVIGVALDSETLEKKVVYEAQYDDPEFGQNALWVRPLEEFLGTVEIDGKSTHRFTLTEE